MNKLMMAFTISTALAFLFTPIVKMWAEKAGAIDIPKDDRRVHKNPIPLLGGLSIYFACVLGILIFIPLDQKIIGILLGSTIIVIGGYYDDIHSLSPKSKLLVQILAAIVAIHFGIKIDRFTNPLFSIAGEQWIEMKLLAYPVTVLWIVGLTNAFNLIDGLDGLAAGVSTISSVTLLVAAISLGPEQLYIPVLTAIVAGSTLGFLPYNFNPAKIFMGDTGAMFLGYMLSLISIIGVLKSAAALAFLVPILAMGLPILDTLFSMIRRIASGRSVAEADRGHFHHRLINKGYTQKQAVLTLYSISAFFGLGAIAMIANKFNMTYILVLVVFFFISVGARHQGFLETRGDKNNIDI